ncbi:MAG: hypothetical protein IKP64_03610 [Selenomonadaceae bacterium]|nr:hypothetical protein [Selenomonadaceae bacterium]MBR4382625.1 hypothetical protein [Selenomonadaceae bacterium]
MQLGNRKFIDDSFGTTEKYLEIAQADETAAVALQEKRLFNQAAYFFIQAMEKHVKYHIAKKINVTNPFFAEELRQTMGHSLDESLNLLFKVYTGNNEVLFNQLNFSRLHNTVRYPVYNPRRQNYSFLDLGARDCETLRNMLTALKKYLEEVSRRVL